MIWCYTSGIENFPTSENPNKHLSFFKVRFFEGEGNHKHTQPYNRKGVEDYLG